MQVDTHFKSLCRNSNQLKIKRSLKVQNRNHPYLNRCKRTLSISSDLLRRYIRSASPVELATPRFFPCVIKPHFLFHVAFINALRESHHILQDEDRKFTLYTTLWEQVSILWQDCITSHSWL